MRVVRSVSRLLLLAMGLVCVLGFVPTPMPVSRRQISREPAAESWQEAPMVEKSLPVTVMKAKKTSKGIGGGKKTGGGGAAAPRGWTQVMASESELGSSVGSQKAVGPVAARGGAEKFLLLVRRENKEISAVEATCGRCKFPLLSGRVVEEPSIEDEDKGAIVCPLCAATHSFATGEIVGAKAQGILQSVSSQFFSRTVASMLPVYGKAAVDGTGAVYVDMRI